MTVQQERKQAIRKFMRDHYTDERLAQLLAHAQDGKLAYASCCCFIGIATADHPLRGKAYWDIDIEKHLEQPHFKATRKLEGWYAAEMAYSYLANNDDPRRIRILIPMIRAEMRRRELARISLPQFSAEVHIPTLPERGK